LQSFENSTWKIVPSCDLRIECEQAAWIDRAQLPRHRHRARELYYAVDDEHEEKQSLDDAMCILHALRRSLTAVDRLSRANVIWVAEEVRDAIVDENRHLPTRSGQSVKNAMLRPLDPWADFSAVPTSFASFHC